MQGRDRVQNSLDDREKDREKKQKRNIIHRVQHIVLRARSPCVKLRKALIRNRER